MADDARGADAAARRLAQTDFTRPLVLEAGAGTGKTTTLVARVLAWCLGPGWVRHHRRLEDERRRLGKRQAASDDDVAAAALGRVVAITFTEAAAAEMAERVARELAALTDPAAEVPGWLAAELPPPAERARRATALLATLDHFVVRTIHAFCRGLLAAHPLEARLHPELTVDPEGLRVEEVARECVETALRRAYVGAGGGEDDPYLALAVAGYGPRQLVEALVTLAQAGVPADGLDEDPLTAERVAALRERIVAAARRLYALLAPHAPHLKHNAGKLLASLSGLGERLGGDLPSLLADLGEDFPEPGKGIFSQLAKWRGHDFNKGEQQTLAGCADDVAAAAGELRALLRHAGRLDPALLALAQRALAPLHRRLRGELRSRGVVTFEDLLVETARLLVARPDVAARERARIDQLLVDEFQDTDGLQCEIVARLSLAGAAEQRPGLFLVGDPKQSIYGWRSADLAAYEGFVERVIAAGGARAPLVENFRSVPAILDEVTRVVGAVMAEESGVQPPFQPLVACARLAGEAGFVAAPPALVRRPVEHWVSWQTDLGGRGEARDGLGTTPKGAADEIEADAIAADVRDLHDREGVAWRDVALLLRAATDLDVYLDALRRRGVPFAVGRDKQYYQRREVIDAAALVRAVLDPGDHLALLTLLRSPAVGVPDAALVPLWNRDLPRRLTELTGPDRGKLDDIAAVVREAAAATPRDVPGIERVAGWPTSLTAAVEHLAHARAAFGDREADRFVATLRSLFLVEATAAARYLGAYRLANLERFFRRLTAALEEGGGDVTAVLRALRRSVAEAREAPEGQPGEGDRDAVQVMTVHQAKGLDWPHVYLPQLHHQSGGGPKAFEVERVAGGFEWRLFGTPSLGWDRVDERRRRVEAAERVRLLYVAMTRAEVRLVLAGRHPETPQPADPARATSMLELLAHRPGLPADLAERFRAAAGGDGVRSGEAAGGDVAHDADGALWRFPALTAWPLAPGTETPPAPPAAERIAESSRRLAHRQDAAEAHRARPFAATASEEAHHRLEEALADEAGALDPRPLDRAVALAVGTALHRALEDFEPQAEPGAEVDRLRAALPGWLAGDLAAEAREDAVREATTLFDQVAAGPLLGRLRALAPHLVGREIPLLLAPPKSAGTFQAVTETTETKSLDKAAGTSSSTSSKTAGTFEAEAEPTGLAKPPVGYFSGAIDLLYRDPEDGSLVVADFKTDHLEGEGLGGGGEGGVALDAALVRRAAVYAPQGRVYVRAVATALGLAAPPRFELWFLRAGRVAAVDLDAAAPPSAPSAPAAVAEPAAAPPDPPPVAEPAPAREAAGEANEATGPARQLGLFD